MDLWRNYRIEFFINHYLCLLKCGGTFDAMKTPTKVIPISTAYTRYPPAKCRCSDKEKSEDAIVGANPRTMVLNVWPSPLTPATETPLGAASNKKSWAHAGSRKKDENMCFFKKKNFHPPYDM